MASAILDIQCVLDSNSKYIIKVMSIVDIDRWASQHWIFKHTRTRDNMAKVNAVNMWLFRNYHQLTWGRRVFRNREDFKILKFRMRLHERRRKASNHTRLSSRCKNYRDG